LSEIGFSQRNSYRDTARYRKKTRCHPQNQKYITYRNDFGAWPSHGHRQRAQKFSKDRAWGSISSRTHRHTNSHSDTHTQLQTHTRTDVLITILRNRSHDRSALVCLCGTRVSYAKWLNWSRCRLGGWLLWLQGTMY